ncbi:unnamed protein product, partial [Larinioides sclopetarius]
SPLRAGELGTFSGGEGGHPSQVLLQFPLRLGHVCFGSITGRVGSTSLRCLTVSFQGHPPLDSAGSDSWTPRLR